MIKYKKSTIDHAIYIKVLSDGTVSYLTVTTDYFLSTTNNETEFPEPRRVFEEAFEIKVQEGSVLKYRPAPDKFSSCHEAPWSECWTTVPHPVGPDRELSR